MVQRLPEYPENVPSENQVPCQVRCMKYMKLGVTNHFLRSSDENYVDDLQVLLRLVSERFPYVYSLMNMVFEWDGFERRVGKHQEEDNPSSSSSDDG
jgi:hypothetical protein